MTHTIDYLVKKSKPYLIYEDKEVATLKKTETGVEYYTINPIKP